MRRKLIVDAGVKPSLEDFEATVMALESIGRLDSIIDSQHLDRVASKLLCITLEDISSHVEGVGTCVLSLEDMRQPNTNKLRPYISTLHSDLQVACEGFLDAIKSIFTKQDAHTKEFIKYLKDTNHVFKDIYQQKSKLKGLEIPVISSNISTKLAYMADKDVLTYSDIRPRLDEAMQAIRQIHFGCDIDSKIAAVNDFFGPFIEMLEYEEFDDAQKHLDKHGKWSDRDTNFLNYEGTSKQFHKVSTSQLPKDIGVDFGKIEPSSTSYVSLQVINGVQFYFVQYKGDWVHSLHISKPVKSSSPKIAVFDIDELSKFISELDAQLKDYEKGLSNMKEFLVSSINYIKDDLGTVASVERQATDEPEDYKPFMPYVKDGKKILREYARLAKELMGTQPYLLDTVKTFIELMNLQVQAYSKALDKK